MASIGPIGPIGRAACCMGIAFVILPALACSRTSEKIEDESAGRNGGFEVTRSGLPVNWLVYAPSTIPTGEYELSFDTADHKEGSQSLKFLVHECSATGGWHSPGIAQELPAIPGETYRLSFWLKNEGCDWVVSIGSVDAKTGHYETIDTSNRASDSWQRIEHVFTVPRQYQTVRFELSIRSPGSLWIDDVRMEPVVEETGFELPYMGEEPPGETPILFAPGVVNTEAIELNGVFSPDGREFFFTRIVDEIFTMHHSVEGGGKWSEPRPVLPYPGQAKAMAVDMAFSPDGQDLYFLGRFPNEISPEEPGHDIWVSRRQNGGWSSASLVPPPVSTEASEFYPCVVEDGSLYFSSDRPGGVGASDVYRAQRLADGSFAAPVNLGPPVNSEAGEGDTYVAPDESYLIVTSRRPGGLGQADLYISFRQAEGSWGEPVSLGPAINSELTDFCPMVTPDGKYLFFSRRHGDAWETATAGDVYWVDARILERLRP